MRSYNNMHHPQDDETISTVGDLSTLISTLKADDGTNTTRTSTTGHRSPDPVCIQEKKTRLEEYEYKAYSRRDSLCSVQKRVQADEVSLKREESCASSIGLRTAMMSEVHGDSTRNHDTMAMVEQLEKRNAAISSTFAKMVTTLVKTIDEQQEIIEQSTAVTPKQKRRWSMNFEKRQSQVESCEVMATAMSDKQKELFARVHRTVGELEANAMEKSAENRRLSHHLNVIKSTMKKLRNSKKKNNEHHRRRTLDNFLQENEANLTTPTTTTAEPDLGIFSICQITCTSTVVDVNELSQKLCHGNAHMKDFLTMADDEAVRLMV